MSADVVKATLEFPNRTYECVWPVADFTPARAAAQIAFEAKRYAADYEKGATHE